MSTKAYILLHLGQLLVQPASVRASGDRRGAHGLRRGAALTSGLIDQLLCGVQDLQHLRGDAAEWGCCVFLLQENTSARTEFSNQSCISMKKCQNVLCLANSAMQTEGKCSLVCASTAVMKLMSMLKKGLRCTRFPCSETDKNTERREHENHADGSMTH